MKKKSQEKGPDNGRWLLTYSDLITLLMIFFVVMYASSNVDSAKYKAISESLNVVFTGGGNSTVGTDQRPNISKDTSPIDSTIVEENKMKEIKKQVDTYLKENFISDNVKTNIDKRGLVISLNNTLFFDTGKAEIKLESNEKLIEIGKMLNKINNYVRVEGHTDNIPIKNDRFKSNWQLSCERAANVTMLLIEKSGVSPEKVSAVGYGECRPIGDNKLESGRAKNRRVDIVIMNSKFNEVENTK